MTHSFPTRRASDLASSSTKTDTTPLTFVAGFTSGSWTGDLIASPFNAALTGVSNQPKWILSKTFPGVTDTGNVYADVNKDFAVINKRPVLTMKGGTASLFDSNMAGASALGSEEQTSELQSLMRISYAVFSLKKQK